MEYDDIALKEINRLQKQNDLLTLGLLQEKNKVAKLIEIIYDIRIEDFSGQSTLSAYIRKKTRNAFEQFRENLAKGDPDYV